MIIAQSAASEHHAGQREKKMHLDYLMTRLKWSTGEEALEWKAKLENLMANPVPFPKPPPEPTSAPIGGESSAQGAARAESSGATTPTVVLDE